jgi:hypothetical protein
MPGAQICRAGGRAWVWHDFGKFGYTARGHDRGPRLNTLSLLFLLQVVMRKILTYYRANELN